MIAGVVVFLLWLALRWESLESLGACVILGGLALFPIGIVCWMMSIDLSAGEKAVADARFHQFKLALPLVLLLANFPLALGIVMAATNFYTRYYVTIENQSPTPMNGTVITYSNSHVELGTIHPGQRVTRYFHMPGDGAVTCEFTFAGVPRKCVIAGYVSRNQGGDMYVVVRPNGEFAVTDVRFERIVQTHGLKTAD
jgi:hypothetical protein